MAPSEPASPAPATTPVRPLLLALVGPTAVGKTAASIQLAQALQAEIISADSRYLYRGMDIGTAKPTLDERAGIPHHLIDVTTPDQPWSLAQYQAAAMAAIAAVHARGRLPLLVGGTGQYVRALTEGWQIPAGEAGGVLRAELEETLAAAGLPVLVERLWQVDPASAAQVDLKNPRRVLRALEVALSTGRSFVEQRGRAEPAFEVLQFGLSMPRPELYARIDARVDWMLQAGLLAEVKALLAQGYDWRLPAMSALGYRQIGQHLRGEITLEEAVQLIKRDTRKFVRRQANWFKPTDPAITWFSAGPDAVDRMVEHLRAWLAGPKGSG